MWEENPRKIFLGKPTKSDRDWKPNPHSDASMIWTGVLEVEGKETTTQIRPPINDLLTEVTSYDFNY